jgi:hypothetical protein
MTIASAGKSSRMPRLYGLLAEFDSPERLLQAARAARLAGYHRMDGYSPFPVDGLAEALGFRFNLLPWLVLGGGATGACGGYFMQWFASVVSYPINVGGRPLNSWPSFVPITFELGVLFASLTALIGMASLCGLPRPYHPVFNAPEFSLETQGKFFLCIQADDPRFDISETRQFVTRLGARGVTEVEHWTR